MPKITLKEGEFRTGVSSVGLGVIGFYPSIMDFKDPQVIAHLNDADIWAQWIAAVDKISMKMDLVFLEIGWPKYHEQIRFPFLIQIDSVRQFVKKVAGDKMVLLVNVNPTDDIKKLFITGMGNAISVDITRGEVLDWIALEDAGKTIKDWKPDNPNWNPAFKDGGMRRRF
ncbi:MAG: hypothetical protein WC208_10385 [Gallionella sp.]|jgi:hypothetical protein